MNSVLLWAAVGASFLTFCVHTFVGEFKVARPLLASKDVPFAAKWLNFYCWHITTIYTLLMGAGYSYVAINPDKPELAVFLTLLNGCLAVLSFTVGLKAKINPFLFPSTSLFTLVTVLATCAFYL